MHLLCHQGLPPCALYPYAKLHSFTASAPEMALSQCALTPSQALDPHPSEKYRQGKVLVVLWVRCPRADFLGRRTKTVSSCPCFCFLGRSFTPVNQLSGVRSLLHLPCHGPCVPGGSSQIQASLDPTVRPSPPPLLQVSGHPLFLFI